jgi:hypothetical protein
MNEIKNEISKYYDGELVEYIINKYKEKISEIPWHKIKIALDKIKKRQENYSGIVSMEICKYYHSDYRFIIDEIMRTSKPR